ncbi:MAG: hypothetical protein JWQ01_1035 [Massilia sp.]|jgi:hypothetical protein|nr:hypothetical protein [Massilia sp.]
MGSSLHNKIHLGRTPLFASRWLRAGLAVAVTVSAGVAWMALHSFK